jgi:hypothetical protein
LDKHASGNLLRSNRRSWRQPGDPRPESQPRACCGTLTSRRSRRRFCIVKVTDPSGHLAAFGTWRLSAPGAGALAHAIFIHDHSLDYFHTHVCWPEGPHGALGMSGIGDGRRSA